MTAAQEWMLEGMEKGLAKGRQEGLAKGRQEGRQEGRLEGQLEGREEGERAALASTLTRLIRLRFRDIPAETVARIEAASKSELNGWIERILTAETLDDLFA